MFKQYENYLIFNSNESVDFGLTSYYDLIFNYLFKFFLVNPVKTSISSSHFILLDHQLFY